MNSGHMITNRFAVAMLALVGTSGFMIGAGIVTTLSVMVTRPESVIVVSDDDIRSQCQGPCGRDTATVTRHEEATHIVTGDGRLIIVPVNPAECVRLALPSAEYAECVPEYVG